MLFKFEFPKNSAGILKPADLISCHKDPFCGNSILHKISKQDKPNEKISHFSDSCLNLFASRISGARYTESPSK